MRTVAFRLARSPARMRAASVGVKTKKIVEKEEKIATVEESRKQAHDQ